MVATVARNGSGTYVRVHDWTTDAAAGVAITASRVDAEADDMATALSESIARDGQTTITANIPFASFKLTGLGSGTARTDAANFGQVTDVSSRAAACRLTYTNATTLTLVRKGGDRLCIQSVNEQIPAAGVTLSNSGLAADTTYNIYAYMSGSTMTLEASTTAHVESSTTGMEIKSGASTRTLVGMARTNGSSQFFQSSSSLGVITYFNQRLKFIKSAFSTDRTTTSTSYTEINTEIRLPFLTWGNHDISWTVRGVVSNNTNAAKTYTAVAIDTTIRGGTLCEQAPGLNGQNLNAAIAGYSDETEGYHYATIYGKVPSGTGTWNGGAATAEQDITLSVAVLG